MKAKYERPLIVRHTLAGVNKFGAIPAIRPMTNIDGVPIEELVAAYGSPLFVFSEATLRERVRELRSQLGRRFASFDLGWSYKTNYLGAICRVFHQEGSLAEVVSGMELRKALAAGVTGRQIIFNGPAKTAGLRKTRARPPRPPRRAHPGGERGRSPRRVARGRAAHQPIRAARADLGSLRLPPGERPRPRGGAPDGARRTLDTMASFNAMLTAMVVGGVWFVPQPSSMALAAGAAGFSVLVTYALMPLLGMLSLPVLSLPFVVTVLTVLTAARMRQQDRWPRSATPADRPEEALARHLSRVRRFGDLAWVPFRLPFRGEWFVSQGWDGEHTHKGLWRHGLDFEGRTAVGKAHRGEGRELRDYVCCGLPVVAAGAGTVAAIVDGVEDNRPGEVNTRENWGNAVVIAHGPALHSVYAHLQPRSIRVKVGDVVTPGMELGRCGNSGRSAVPHLHLQVQRGVALGSPTIPFELGDVVERQGEVPTLGTHMVPEQGSFVRPVQRDDGVAQAAVLTPGTVLELRERDGTRVERAKVELDLLGTRWLSSPNGRVAFETYDNGLVLLDCHVDHDSLLRYLVLAWARLPFDQSAQLRWQDSLSRRWLLPRWSRLLTDVLTVVAPVWGGLEVTCSLKRKEGAVEVEGNAADWSCRSVLSLAGSHASHRLTVEHQGITRKIEIRQVEVAGREAAA